MITVCWAAKGGSGTTVVAAAMALAWRRPTLLIDHAGGVPAVLGMPEPDGQGVVRLAGVRRAGGGLDDARRRARRARRRAAARRGRAAPAQRWAELATWLRE